MAREVEFGTNIKTVKRDINYLGRHPKNKELGHAHINVLNTIMIVSDEIFQINKNFIINILNNFY